MARRHAREAYEEYAETRADLRGAGPDAAGLDGEGRPQRPAQGHRQRQDRPQASGPSRREKQAAKAAPDRAADRAARGGRGAAQGVGAADGDRGRAAGRRGRGHAARRGRPARRRSRSARSTCRSTGPTGSPSPAPTARASPRCCAALLGRIPLDDGQRRLGPGVVVGEIDQARGAVPRRRSRCCDAFRAAVPDLTAGRRAHAAGQVRPARRRTCCGRPRRCRRASAPGPRWRCCRPAASTCWCWTSRPTTSTCRRSSSWSRRWQTYPGTLLLVTHDRRMLDAVHTNRRLTVADGHVTES